MIKIVLFLDGEMERLLKIAANRDVRNPQQQAYFILRNELEKMTSGESNGVNHED